MNQPIEKASRRLIEHALPVKQLSQEGAREKAIRHGHISAWPAPKTCRPSGRPPSAWATNTGSTWWRTLPISPSCTRYETRQPGSVPRKSSVSSNTWCKIGKPLSNRRLAVT